MAHEKEDWPEVKCLQLIDLYETKPVLWNIKLPDYFNKLKKNDAWTEISHELQSDNATCKDQINALLVSFRSERRKVRKSSDTGKGADEIYNSSWFAFNRMQFLKVQNMPSPSVNTDGVCASSIALTLDTLNLNNLPPEVLGRILSFVVMCTNDYQKYSTVSSSFAEAMKESCVYQNVFVDTITLDSIGQFDNVMKLLHEQKSAIKSLTIDKMGYLHKLSYFPELLANSNLRKFEVVEARFHNSCTYQLVKIMKSCKNLKTVIFKGDHVSPLGTDSMKKFLNAFKAMGLKTVFMKLYCKKSKCESFYLFELNYSKLRAVTHPDTQWALKWRKDVEDRQCKHLTFILEAPSTRKDFLMPFMIENLISLSVIKNNLTYEYNNF